MKKTSKMLIIMVSIMISVMFVVPLQQVYALDTNNLISGVETNTDTNSVDTGTLQKMAGSILAIIQVASAIAAVVLVAVFGFKFILGSAQEKSDYMKSFVPLIVGVVIVFAASSIARIIFSVANTGVAQ